MGSDFLDILCRVTTIRTSIVIRRVENSQSSFKESSDVLSNLGICIVFILDGNSVIGAYV